MDIINLDTVKKYLRIDYDLDDDLLESFMKVASSYVEDSLDNVDKLLESENTRQKIKILMLVLIQELYDNRENSEKRDFSYTVRSMMTQLQARC